MLTCLSPTTPCTERKILELTFLSFSLQGSSQPNLSSHSSSSRPSPRFHNHSEVVSGAKPHTLQVPRRGAHVFRPHGCGRVVSCRPESPRSSQETLDVIITVCSSTCRCTVVTSSLHPCTRVLISTTMKNCRGRARLLPRCQVSARSSLAKKSTAHAFFPTVKVALIV